MYFAKSKPDVLTIAEHTSDVVKAVKALAQAYGNELSFFTTKDFELVEIAAMYHDLGKFSETFQNIIRPSIDKKWRKINLVNYPHNYLSVCLLPFNELRKKYSKEEAEIVALAVGYHHERELNPNEDLILQIYEQYLKKVIPTIKKDIPLSYELTDKANRFAIRAVCNRVKIVNQFDYQMWLKYILIKGLLQRADHAASAKRKGEDVATYVEEAVTHNVGEQTKAFLEKQYSLRPLQTLTYENQDKNIVLIAQTGSGKTEAALLWIGQKKGFITLPMRVSLNAMYDRIQNEKGIGFSSTGLLHSSALDHLMSKSEETTSFEQSIIQTEHTRILAKKLTLSTIDQLFKFPLLYRGFETELATLAYSKVVIDEIQAYDPHIVAILLRGLELIHQLGGQWMIMTATLPQIFLDELQKKGLLDHKSIVETVLIPDDRDENPVMPRRHRIQLLDDKKEALTKIVQFAVSSKVLVVVNTVKEALAMYDQLKERVAEEKINLLHSQFTKKDRLPKEEEIKEFAQLKNDLPGIWVTTQIVEASLDVDFDCLFTEAATPDALFQRFGRCNRKGLRFNGGTPNEPNVFILSNLEEVSGLDTIYEKAIVQKGLEELLVYDGQLIGEPEKIEIVKNVFSREQLAGTKYLAKFDKANQELQNMRAFDLRKEDAQRILRDIQSVSFVAGRDNYEAVMALIEQYDAIPDSLDRIERNKRKKQIRMEIEQYIVSVNAKSLFFRTKEAGFELLTFEHRDFNYIHYSTEVSYDSNRGLELKLDEHFDPFF